MRPPLFVWVAIARLCTDFASSDLPSRVLLRWGLELMIWLAALVVPIVGVPVFVKVYGRRLDALAGPQITKVVARHDQE